MSRIPLIAGNWKMNKTGREAAETAEKLAALCQDVSEVEVMIAPSFLSLAPVLEKINDSRIKLGAQNLFYEKKGAYTGEVSADMIRSAGAEYVLVGHSERRQFFGETDASCRKKLISAIGAELKPVLCIGETEDERDGGKTFPVLDKQLSDGLQGFDPGDLDHLVVAYEPVWAIGTGKTADAGQVDEVHRYLRELLEKRFTRTLSQQTRILYGGSVKPDNAAELMEIEDVDGALVGGASLEPDSFIGIVKYNR